MIQYNIDDLILKEEKDVDFFEIKFSTSGIEDGEAEVYQLFGGKKVVLGKIVNGKKSGLWVNWYENGQKKSAKTFSDGVFCGEHTYWYENGQLEKVCNHFGTGPLKIWYENGQIKKEGFYKEGKLDGVYIIYYENGQIKWKGTKKDGETHAELFQYYENGQIEWEGTYIDGKRNGEFFQYYENGQVKLKGTYIDEKRNGELFQYYENGGLKTKCRFKDGKLNGVYVSYNELGLTEFQSKRKYKNGKLNGDILEYTELGKLIRRGKYKNGESYTGVWNKYFFNGLGGLKESINYIDGLANGEYEKNDPERELKEKGFYVSGKVTEYEKTDSKYTVKKVYSSDFSHSIYLKTCKYSYETELGETEWDSYIKCLEEKINNSRVNWFIKDNDIEEYYEDHRVIYRNEQFKKHSTIEYNGVKIYSNNIGQLKKIELTSSDEIIESFELLNDRIGVIVDANNRLELRLYDLKRVLRSDVGSIFSELDGYRVSINHYEMLEGTILVPYMYRVRYLIKGDYDFGQKDSIKEEFINEYGRVTEINEFYDNEEDDISNLKQGLEDVIGPHSIYEEDDEGDEEDNNAWKNIDLHK